MIPAEFFESAAENEARAFEESTPLSELSDEIIAIGAAYGIPSHVREFIRRNIPDANMPSEEEIDQRVEIAREMVNEQFNQLTGAELDLDGEDNGTEIEQEQ